MALLPILARRPLTGIRDRNIPSRALEARGFAGQDTCKQALRAGARSLEHRYLIDDEGIAMAEKNGAFIVPTMQMTRDAGSGQIADARIVEIPPRCR